MNITRIASLHRLRLAVVAAVAAVAGLVIPVSQIASAHTGSPAGAGGGPKPTIVLVHGAWANSASWNGVIQRLQADGYTVDAPPDPVPLQNSVQGL